MMTWNNREEWLLYLIKQLRPIFTEKGLTIPDKIRVGVSWSARGGMRGKSIGECWTPEASKDGTIEIFVSPKLADTKQVAGVITHELVHAAVGNDKKHGPVFKKAATSLGLEGKMTATTEGPEWHKLVGPILDQMGEYPHAELTGASSSAGPKQGTRMIKCECDTCGMIFRTTKAWVKAAPDGFRCPDLTCEGIVNVDGGEGGE